MKADLNSPKIKELLRTFRTVTVIEHDADIEGATLGQAMLILVGIPDLETSRTDEVITATNAVALKLKGVRYHTQRFKTLQTRRLKEIATDKRGLEAYAAKVNLCEHEMLYEFEAFCFQFKSSLDMLTKILGPALEPKGGSAKNYGDKGNVVIRYLESKKNSNKLVQGRIDYLIELIESAREPWLRSMIDVRDNLTHRRPYIHFGFGWDFQHQAINVPMADVDGVAIPVAELMEIQAGHLIGYVREFVAWTIACAVPLEIHLQPMEEAEKARMTERWGINLMNAKYILRWPTKWEQDN
jgi:hypothetical protein